MSRATVLARGRAAALISMVDACTITRVTGRTTNTTTGAVTQTTSTIYTGACRIQQHQAQAQREDVAEDHLLLLRLEVQVPMTVTGVEVGDRVTITASARDADLVGRVLLVRELAHKTDATARRIGCVEKTES